MGLFDKIKNLFLEEEEVEAKAKQEVKKPVINNQIKDNTKAVEAKKDISDVISERDLFKSDTTFKFPVMFEEEDIMKEKEKSNHTNVLDFEKTKIKNKTEEKEQKIFKPTPVLSPVYGILDKDYKKNMVLEEQQKKQIIKPQKENTATINVDDVRKKAYGTLEDDFENTFSDNDSMFYNLNDNKVEEPKEKMEIEVSIEDNGLDLLDELSSEIETEDITLEQAEENYRDLNISYDIDKNKIEDNIQKNTDDNSNKDNLFDLIDSMYESEGDKEE